MRFFLLPLVATLAWSQGTITVYHQQASVAKGASRQFTAYVPLSPNTVVWSVNGVQGGNSTYGTVTQSGLYKAPTVVPPDNIVFVRATSTAYPTISGQSRVTVQQPVPSLWSVTPRTAAANQTLDLSLSCSSAIPEARVLVNDVPQPTTFVNASQLKARVTFPQAGTYRIQISHPGNGSTTSNTVNVTVGAPPPATVSVTVTPSAASVALAASRQFQASVSGSSNQAVTWTASAGSISAAGLFTAPATMPASPSVTVRATSQADATRFAQATVTLTGNTTPPATVSVTVTPPTASVALGTTSQFQASVTGTSNAAVTWTTNAGSISSTGLFTAPASMPASPTVTIRATSQADSTRFAQATVTLTAGSNPNPPPPLPTDAALISAGRFLEQSAFGPTQNALAEVRQKGIPAYLDEQLAMPETLIPVTSQYDSRALSLNRLAHAPDQLRQRVAWALSQIIVISRNKNPYDEEVIPYLQILSRNAFGNYRTLLKEITLSPQMGKYLDLANSVKPGNGSNANENFPRELLQLFTIGLLELNLDGSPKLANGQPIPTYTQATLRQFALALTGWTYPTAPGAQPRSQNWENFSQPAMEPRPENHDTSQKTLLNGVVLPAGQTVQQDLDGVIDCVFQHPNTAPFVVTRLIRSLVMSNPSPAYISRVANVFRDNGAGVRGDLRAVIKAILLDPEARQDTATPNAGRLKDPIYLYISLIRALDGRISPSNQNSWIFDRVGQSVLAPPSVFGYYSPLYRLPGNSILFGPEFQIYSPTESIVLGNELFQILGNPTGDPSLDLAPFQTATDMNQLLDRINTRLFYGRMTPELRAALIQASQPGYDAKQRAQTALYLAILSGYYAVQY